MCSSGKPGTISSARTNTYPGASANDYANHRAAPTSTPATAAAGFTLSISEPADQTVVNQDTIRVAGRTEPDAVVSVNGNIVTGIDKDGNFATAVSLLEGPNLIEVIASDYAGNQSSQTLTVIYAP